MLVGTGLSILVYFVWGKIMDTGDPGHSAWFQSRVQVLVKSLKSRSSTSSLTPTPVGRSLANRWQQYSPAPLRRLKKLFSHSSESNLFDQLEEDSDELRRQQQHYTKLSDTVPLLSNRLFADVRLKDKSERVPELHERTEHSRAEGSVLCIDKDVPKKYDVLTTEGEGEICYGEMTERNKDDSNTNAAVLITELTTESISQLNMTKIPMNSKLDEVAAVPPEDNAATVTKVTISDEYVKIAVMNDNQMPLITDSHSLLSSREGTDQPTLLTPSIVLDVPQTNDQDPVLPCMESQVAKLQLHISTTPCVQPAARKSPVTVQEWVDSLAFHIRTEEEGGEEPPLEESDDILGLDLGAEAGLVLNVLPSLTTTSPEEPASTSGPGCLVREPSLQSDVTSIGSHCSSVESYLESRKPDPEEILMNLGFGGLSGGTCEVDTELSRIPRRFLQQSKVKGVAIDDFLKHQQDVIETFESGFWGYRGLTGPSHSVPSVIVAKIMEKLREHERDSVPPGSVSSAPNFGTSTPVPSAISKFSKAVRKVLTHTTVLGALPLPRQQQQQSVLTPDNRKFLDNQGSKSPEVPRKRMVIGQQSYTFGYDGDLIEVEPVLTKHKPLVHKDSVISTATSLSFPSIDSDSDTDEHCSEFGTQDHHVFFSPKQFSAPLVSQDYDTQHPNLPLSKRMTSTSLSSWESETSSPVPSSCDHSDSDLKCYPIPSAPWPMRYESIDEDIEITSQNVPAEESSRPAEQTNKHNHNDHAEQSTTQNYNVCTEQPSTQNHSILTEQSSTHEMRMNPNQTDDESIHSSKSINEEADSATDRSHEHNAAKQIHKDITSELLLRRSSLKRQQRILDDDDDEEPVIAAKDIIEVTKQSTMEPDDFPDLTEPSVSVQKTTEPFSTEQVVCDDAVVKGFSVKSELLHVANVDTKGDSFEMEEIHTCGDDDVKSATLSRAWSDSSGFLDGDTETYASRMLIRDGSSEVVLNSSQDELHTDVLAHCSNPHEDEPGEGRAVYSVLPILYHENSPPGSTPVLAVSPHNISICTNDREIVRQRTLSLQNRENDLSSFAVVRRVKSAPHCLENLIGRDELVHRSYSNMFSFCSDESVIHVGVQRSMILSRSERNPSTSEQFLKPGSYHFKSVPYPCVESSCSAKDLQELVGELTDRGWCITMGSDACHSQKQLLHLQRNAVCAGLAAYGRQFIGEQPDDNHQIVEACKEIQTMKDIRDRIAAELRLVADLLEEKPPHTIVEITRKVAALLREQSRLCGELEAVSYDLSSSVYVEPSQYCSVLQTVRDENRHLQMLVERNFQVLVEIRQLLKELLPMKNNS